MSKKLFIVALLLCSIGAQAQSFNWGYPHKITDEKDATITYMVDDKVYKFTEYYDSKKFNRQLDVETYDPRDLEKLESFAIEVEPGKVYGERRDYEALFQVAGAEHKLFSAFYDKKTGKNTLHWQTVDVTTGKIGDYKEVTEINAISMTKSGEFEIAQSPEGNYYAVLVEQPYVKKQAEKIELLLLDSNGIVVKRKKFTFPFIGRRARHNDLYVNDNGQVFFVKSINLKKQKPQRNLYHWDTNSDKINLTDLKQPDNFQIAQYRIDFQEDELLFTGILTSDNSTFFSVSIDYSGRNSGVRATGFLNLKYDKDGQLIYNNRVDLDKAVSNLSIKNIHLMDDFYWVVLERAQINKKSKSSSTGSAAFEYDYTYLNNGFGIGSINSSNGELNYLNLIDTNEPDTRNDNGAYLSILSFVHDDQLHLLYNETRDLRKGAVRVPWLKRFPIHDVIAADGSLVKNEALMAAGIGVEKDETFDLETTSIYEIEPGYYLLRARSGVEFKLGFMRL